MRATRPGGGPVQGAAGRGHLAERGRERGGGRGCRVVGWVGRRGAAGRGPDSGDRQSRSAYCGDRSRPTVPHFLWPGPVELRRLLRPVAAYCGLLRHVAGCCGLSSAGGAPGRAVSESAESLPARRGGPPGDSAMRRRREWEGAGEPAAGGESGPGGVRVHGAAVLI